MEAKAGKKWDEDRKWDPRLCTEVVQWLLDDKDEKTLTHVAARRGRAARVRRHHGGKAAGGEPRQGQGGVQAAS